MFEIPANLLAWFYSLVHNYAIAIAMITVVVMAIITPLTLKSTKGMLEMQRLQPEMKRLQAQYRGDRQKLNEEMMKLYQEHKVNPLASCLPLLAQMPVFFIMFHVIRGLTTAASPEKVAEIAAEQGVRIEVGSFAPQYVSQSTELYQSLLGKFEMLAFGLDLSKSPAQMMSESFLTGLPYALLVVLLAGLYFLQQRQIASRTVNPTMSAGQQKLMQYLPVAFAVIQLFFPTGLVVYYITQTLLRIGQNAYITKRFYGHDESLGRQAQRAGAEARELAKSEKADKAGGAKTATKPSPRSNGKPAATKAKPAPSPAVNRRTTPPKSAKPAPSGGGARPKSGGGSNASGSRHPKPKKK